MLLSLRWPNLEVAMGNIDFIDVYGNQTIIDVTTCSWNNFIYLSVRRERQKYIETLSKDDAKKLAEMLIKSIGE